MVSALSKTLSVLVTSSRQSTMWCFLYSCFLSLEGGQTALFCCNMRSCPASSDWLAYTCMFWSILAIYRMVDNFREGLIFTFFASQEPFAKIKTTKILLSMCKANKLPFNTQPTWNYLYSRQQKGVSKCAFDGYHWSYLGNWNAT